MFESRIAEYQRKGWVLLNKTENTAQLRRGSAGCFPVGLLFCLSILCGILYLIFKGEKVVTLSTNGGEHITGGGWGIWTWVILAVLLNVSCVIGIVLLGALSAFGIDSVITH
jgi:hypothetical protein